MEKVETLFSKGESRFVAVGEIGIDLYWDKAFVKEQKEVFRRQLRLARQYDLPVVIHSRESFEEIYTLLVDENPMSENGKAEADSGKATQETLKRKPSRGIFHCFTGTGEQAQRAIALGFSLGIGGVVTFKNSGLDKVIEGIPLEHLVLETDAPYLAPVPFRGKRNQPDYLLKVAEKIASIKNISVEQVAEITTQNSINIFGT